MRPARAELLGLLAAIAGCGAPLVVGDPAPLPAESRARRMAA